MDENNQQMDLPWPLFSTDRLEASFHDAKPILSDAAAVAEASRCLNCYLAPCINACPTSINIPQFINRISTTDTLGAAQTILDANILGLSCALACPTEVLCEGACVYHGLNAAPIAIGKLQRFAVEKAYDRGSRFYQAGKATGKKVALVGAGPASLACAVELRKLGHEAIIFDKGSRPGGLNTYGIAPYKMKAEVSLREVAEISHVGVVFSFGQALGVELELSQLLNDYDAVFLGMGLGPDSMLRIPGIDHPRVRGAVDFIADLKTNSQSELAWLRSLECVLVIGGGNTALDAARALKALDVAQVIISYRRGQASMSGYAHEFKLAACAQVQFLFNTLPTAIHAENAQTLNVALNVTTENDAGHLMVSDQSTLIRADLVLLAIGQSSWASLLENRLGLEFEQGRLKADPKTGRTGHARIFTGGDLMNGGKEVVNAVAEGKRAAMAIHKELFHD